MKLNNPSNLILDTEENEFSWQDSNKSSEIRWLGRRKTSTARVYLKPGKGKITRQ